MSGDDIGIMKVWDYQTRMCLYTFDQQGSHQENVTSVLFHPEMPLIISGSEDDMICVWDSTTYKQITQL